MSTIPPAIMEAFAAARREGAVESFCPYKKPKELTKMMVAALYRAAHNIDDDDPAHVIQDLAWVVCRERWSIEEATQAVRDGAWYCHLHKWMDRVTRRLFVRAPYVVGQDNRIMTASVQASLQAFEEKHRRAWYENALDPFRDFQFSVPPSSLAGVSRGVCSNCDRKAFMICPRCCCAVNVAEHPIVTLPLQVDVLVHPKENIKTSTSLHAAALSAECRLRHGPEYPSYDPGSTLLLFPDDESVPLTRVDWTSVETIVLIESSWRSANGVACSPTIAPLQRAHLSQTHESTFWRYQERGSAFLCTLEALYWALQERRDALHQDRDRALDDLFFFYAFKHASMMVEHQKKPPRSWARTRDPTTNE